MQRRIFTIGETVFDILLKDGKALSSTAGGSMLNCAVSLARLRHNVYLISEISNDVCGRLMLDFLRDNQIDTRYLAVEEDGQTAVSLALLDHNNDAQYEFYRTLPQRRLLVSMPDFTAADLVAFGSFYALTDAVRQPLVELLQAAKNAGALLYYDPNMRQRHNAHAATMRRYIEENIALADVVRGSHEDFYNIFGVNDLDDIYRHISEMGCRLLVVTIGKEGAYLRHPGGTLFVAAQTLQPVSTIGAGDTFNAGILHGLVEYHLNLKNLVEQLPTHFEAIGKNAVAMASAVCMSRDNYIEKQS